MAVKVNRAAVTNANKLIDDGEVDRDSSWSISTEEENTMLGDPPNWTHYSKFHLGKDPEADAETKRAYHYPLGKGGKVYRKALTAIRQRAAQQGAEDIYAAAGRLLDRIDKKSEGALKGAWWEAKPKAQGEGNVLYVYGDIGENPWDEESWSARAMVRALEGFGSAPLDIHVNSWGGSVADGLAIYNAIRAYPGPTKVLIDAMAVSIASLIALAGDTVEMAANAMMMIHAPWSATVGNANDHRDAADMLDTHARAMLTCYAARDPAVDVGALLADGKDHWFDANEALEAGLVDSVTGARKEAAQFAEQSRFNPPNRRASAMSGKKEQPGAGAPAGAEPGGAPGTGAAAPGAESGAGAGAPAAKVVGIEEARGRSREIVQAFAPHLAREGVQELQTECLANPECTIAQAREKLLELIGEGAEPLAGNAHVSAGQDARERFVAGARASLIERAGIKAEPALYGRVGLPAPEAEANRGNLLRGHTLFELARAALEVRGIGTGHMSRMQVVGAAFTMTDSDFPNLLANIAHLMLLKGWDEAPETFQKITSPGVLPDFKTAKRAGLNVFDNLTEVVDGAEYSYGTLSDRGESIALATYGKLFAITRKAVINDDLHAFSRIPAAMGRAAKRTIGNLVYAVLTGNPAMADGHNLFDATNHSNLVPSGSGAAPDSNTINAAIVAMATQQDPDKKATALNIPLRYVIVPMALKAKALQAANSEFEVDASNVNVRRPNPVRGAFDVIADARLDANSATAWYGSADPGAFDTIEVAYLDGQQEPYLEQQRGFEIDGVSYKVRIDAGVSPLDFRTLYKNAGA